MKCARFFVTIYTVEVETLMFCERDVFQSFRLDVVSYGFVKTSNY
jgi:hypothetical protein